MISSVIPEGGSYTSVDPWTHCRIFPIRAMPEPQYFYLENGFTGSVATPSVESFQHLLPPSPCASILSQGLLLMLVGYRPCDPVALMTFFPIVVPFGWLPRLARDQSFGTLSAIVIVNLEMRPT